MKKTAQKEETRKRAYDIVGYPLTRYNKITDEILKNYGFTPMEKPDVIGRTVWRMQPPFYRYEFRFINGTKRFPAQNPNCGILMIHEPETEAVGFKQLKSGKLKKYTVKSKAFTTAIAHHVNTAERLRSIILLLTEENV